MPMCWGCGKTFESLSKHLFGRKATRNYPCPAFLKLYNNKTLATKEWELLDDPTSKALDVGKWRARFGEGSHSVYIYVTKQGKRFTRVGQTAQSKIQKRKSAGREEFKPVKPSTSSEKVLGSLPKKSDSQLELLRRGIEREQQERRTSTAESRKRERPADEKKIPTGERKKKR